MHPMYGRLLDKRKRNTQTPYYESPQFNSPTAEELEEIEHIRHIWTAGDRFYKLAALYYSDPKAWWVIALYNGKPTEGHVKPGDLIYIPTPVGRIVAYYGF